MVMKSMEAWETMTHEQFVQQGIDNYDKSSAADKIAIQKKMGKFDSTCESYNTLMKQLLEHKPLAFCAIGTTGLNEDGKDEIMQICITSYTYDAKDGRYKQDNGLSKNTVMPLSEEKLQKVVSCINGGPDGKQYDYFKSGGFDRPTTQNGVGISSQSYINGVKSMQPEEIQKYKDRVSSEASALFKTLAGMDTLYIGLNNNFAKPFLDGYKIEVPMKMIDMLDVMKEHDYKEKNIINEGNTRYSLNAIVSQYPGHDYNNEDGQLYSSLNTCKAMAGVILDIMPLVRDRTAQKQVPDTDISRYQTKEDIARMAFYKFFDEHKATDKENAADKENITCYTTDENQKDVSDISMESGNINEFEQAMGIAPSEKQGDKEPFEQTVQEYTEAHPEEVMSIRMREQYLNELLDKIVGIFTSIQDLSKETKDINSRLAKIEASLEKKPSKRTSKKDAAKTAEPAKETVQEAPIKDTQIKESMSSNQEQDIQPPVKEDDGYDR